MNGTVKHINPNPGDIAVRNVKMPAEEVLQTENGQENPETQAQESRKRGVQPVKYIQGVLDGTILAKGEVFRLIPFIFYLVVLIMLVIGNTYYAEKMVGQIESIKKELKELRYEQITTRSELMTLSKASEVARRLKPSGLKESMVPPEKIILKNNKENPSTNTSDK